MAGKTPESFRGTRVTFPNGPIEIDLIFCEHNSAKSLPAKFGQIALGADVIGLESVGWTTEGAELRQAISSGSVEALSRMLSILPPTPQGEFWAEVSQKLLGTKAQVHYPDVPKGHPVTGRYATISQKADEALMAYMKSQALGYDISSSVLLTHLRKLFSVIKERDRYIVENLFPALVGVAQNGSPLGYLALFGSVHEWLGDFIEESAENQGRSDVVVRQHVSGVSDGTAYGRYLDGIPPGIEDVEEWFNLK